LPYNPGNMRKLIVSMNLSLDGYMSGPRGDLDWHFETWNEEMGEKLLEQLEKADTILLGRITYETMAKYWSVKPLKQNFPRQDLAIADKLNRYTKVVFSGTGMDSIWENTVFAIRNPELEILSLKQQKGKDIILYGSGALVSALIQSGLVDEYLLWIHPVILGRGKPLFNKLNTRLNLKLKNSFLFDSGVVALRYSLDGKA
jgi:dihydrofolate reductase